MSSAPQRPEAGSPPTVAPPTVALSFVDVLFGLAAAQVLTSAFGGSHLRADEWSHMLVPLVLISCSWIGYHLNRSRAHPPEAEFTRQRLAPLAQFAIDIALVALYYRLATRVLADHTTFTEFRLLSWVFFLYLVWDLLDPFVTGDAVNALRRAAVDGIAFVLVLTLGVVPIATPWTVDRIVAKDSLFILLLVAYRFAQARVAVPAGRLN